MTDIERRAHNIATIVALMPRAHDPRDAFRDVLGSILGHRRREPIDECKGMLEPQQWSAAVRRLALAFYRGDDCQFALRDALMDMGCDLAACHFDGRTHRPNCEKLLSLLVALETP